MRLDVKKQLLARSERVKGIGTFVFSKRSRIALIILDFHEKEPWILTTLYSGKANVWDYSTATIIKTFDLTDVPVRAGRFIARRNWIVCGSDDFQLRIVGTSTLITRPSPVSSSLLQTLPPVQLQHEGEGHSVRSSS